MQTMMRRFWRDESGQDLIEYTLLLAFLALAAASIFISSGQAVQGIWGTSTTTLGSANTAAS